MQRILVQNNLYLLQKYEKFREAKLLYAPIYYSQVQLDFFKERFEELKSLIPSITWCEHLEESDYDLALSLDALYENNAFGNKIFREQNRLFSELPFPVPGTFTPFRKLAEKYLPDFYPDAVQPYDKVVLKELDYYFRKTRLPLTYLETRNEMTGRDGSTKFSPYLSSGALDVRHLYNEVRTFEAKHGATQSTGWIIFELLWREYFYWHYQINAREYFSKNGVQGPLDFSPVKSYSLTELSRFKAEPFFHAAIAELTQTGFMSNRARQIFASMWINDYKLDWRSGAQFFEEHLIDYDVYSNYGNWMYLAGVGVDPRGQRYFNVEKQLDTYDPNGSYLKKYRRSTL